MQGYLESGVEARRLIQGGQLADQVAFTDGGCQQTALHQITAKLLQQQGLQAVINPFTYDASNIDQFSSIF